MKYRFYFLSFAFVLLFFSCEESGGGQGTTSVPSAPAPSAPPSDAKAPQQEVASTAPSFPEKHNCTLSATPLDGNECYLKTAQQLVCILADSTTKDIDFGESHRILEVYDTKDCSLLSRATLPVNYSPDFPYYLSLETFEDKNKMICTQGYEYVFCYDVEGRKMLPRLVPKYLQERSAEDAQSGAPQGLQFWENTLLGYAQDYGAFAFDYSDKFKPKAFLPTAEFAPADGGATFHSLFLVRTKEGFYQALVPVIDEEDMRLQVRVLFERARKINPVLDKNVRNNRFLIFKDLEATAENRLAIDLQRIESVVLPPAIASQKTSAILAWLKGRE
ncbi:MAG: hypothetical protein AAF985_05695 [Bacteroidota bacterium]